MNKTPCHYGKSARLLKRADFLRLTSAQNKKSCKGFLVVWEANGLSNVRLGITVSKKVGCAVVRNRIKRYVREFFRQNDFQLPQIDMIIIARREASEFDYSILSCELGRIFKQIGAHSV